MSMMDTLQDRFEAKFEPEPNSGCWLWTASTFGKGYGQIGISRSKNEAAHRVSYRLYKGGIPTDKIVMHKCDVPCCVNPDHLTLGSYKDNVADMMQKGRANFRMSKMKSRAKLTRDDVMEIRTRRLSASEYSKIYGITAAAVYHAQKRITWKDVA